MSTLVERINLPALTLLEHTVHVESKAMGMLAEWLFIVEAGEGLQRQK